MKINCIQVLQGKEDLLKLGPCFYGDIWSALQTKLNFTYKLVILSLSFNFKSKALLCSKISSIDGKFGIKEDDGSFSGIVIITKHIINIL